MTLSEAIVIMKIMATADSWCSQCGPSLIDSFGKAFPQFADILLTKNDIEKLRERYNKKLDENIDNDIFEEIEVWKL